MDGCLELVQHLVGKLTDADLSTLNEDGWTPVNVASAFGHLEIQFLAEKGADILRPNSAGKTTLNSASGGGNLEVIKFLVERGADISTTDNMGWRALHQASSSGHEGVVKYLLEANMSDLDSLDRCGRTPLFYAARRGHVSLLQFLHSCGSPLNTKDCYGATSLFAAVRNGQKESAQLLLDRNDEFIFQDGLGRSLTWWASQRGFTDLVESVHRYAKEAGIEMTEEEEQIATSSDSPPSEFDGRWCDVCTRVLFSELAPYHSFTICWSFHICEDCFGIGAKCLDDSHEWTFNQPDADSSDIVSYHIASKFIVVFPHSSIQ
ncbi:hypothetical protein N7488_002582 [Penicillium malachiteum]|nr:hypothetical protein N7488_002582 [Penicillium malachiteum]